MSCMSCAVARPLPLRGVLFGHQIVGHRNLRWLDRSAPSPFPAIRICVADTSDLSVLKGRRPWTEATSNRRDDGTVVLDTCELGAFVLDPKNGTLTAPSFAVGTAFWERRVLNWAIPILLAEQGTIVLHAAGIVTPAGAVLVVGVSTAGKSTFADASRRLGYRLLSEDGVAVTRDLHGDGFLAWPGPAGMRLRHRRDGRAALQRTRAIRPESRCSDPIKLAGVVLLKPRTADGGPIVPLGAAASVATLAMNSFSHGSTLSSHYFDLVEIARAAPVRATSLRNDLSELPNEVRRVLGAFGPAHPHGSGFALPDCRTEGGENE
jgi:hypothetical protein